MAPSTRAPAADAPSDAEGQQREVVTEHAVGEADERLPDPLGTVGGRTVVVGGDQLCQAGLADLSPVPARASVAPSV